ncbi:recombination regulator RecX [Corynebacterium vitaeruminis]|uniref:Regulatory protein RecX n=1 Tax=Corynebacterium vitaeruminis DSM 20294 TaxID=1224164 RepID=W5Y919_9CORY|nr:recombination regulator RecX [Corynebacterium vitaeruminis]AHI23003.1 recombination regulator RecX [Corynebacterium vitaeruminis DSM 20294]
MSSIHASAPDQTKLEVLRTALEQYQPGANPLFDRQLEEEKAKVRNRALLLLDQRARSREELHRRLVKLEFEPALVGGVLDDLQRAGLINDSDFAAEWVRQRSARRGKSRRALAEELKAKGVDSSTRAEALSQISDADEQSTARALAEKKVRSLRSVPADRGEYDKVLRRVVGMLARRGFGSGQALAVSKRALEERIAELGG